MRFSEREKAFFFVETEQAPSSIGGEQQASILIAGAPGRAGPLSGGEMDGGTVDLAGSGIEAPEPGDILLSEHRGTAHCEAAQTRRFPRNGNHSRFDIHGEQVARGYTNDGFSRNTFAEIGENRRSEAPLLDPVLGKVQIRQRHGAAALRSVHESDHARSTAAYGCGAR